jgi:uncharacterized protein (DUF4415 family)
MRYAYDREKKISKKSLKRPLKRASVKPDDIRAIERPSFHKPKKRVSLRLDFDVVEHYRTSGRGWQTGINNDLRRALHLPRHDKRG